MPLGGGKITKRFRRVTHRVADTKHFKMQRRIFLVHARQRDQRVDQLFQLFGLRHRLVDPLLLTGFHFQHLKTGGNHGNGGFQLVAGIGDELFLAFGCLHHRIDRPSGKDAHHHIHQRDTHRRRRH